MATIPLVETVGPKISPKKQERIDFDSEAARRIIAKERKAMRIRKWIVGTAAVLLPMLVMSAVIMQQMDRIVQNIVEHATLEFREMSMTNLAQDGFTMHLVSKIAGLPFVVPVSAMNTSLRNEHNVEYARLQLPGFKSRVIDASAHTQITNQDEFVAFTQDLLKEKIVHLRIYGKTTARVAGRDRPIVFDKMTSIAGLGGPAIQVKSVVNDKLQSLPLHATVEIVNPSPLEIQMGNITFATSYKNISIGSISGLVNLRKGVTRLEQFGMLNSTELAHNAEAFKSFSQEVAKGTVRAQLKGVRAASGISWVEKLVRGIDRVVDLPLKGLSS